MSHNAILYLIAAALVLISLMFRNRRSSRYFEEHGPGVHIKQESFKLNGNMPTQLSDEEKTALQNKMTARLQELTTEFDTKDIKDPRIMAAMQEYFKLLLQEHKKT